MFDSKQTLTKQLANAADLMIDFATLGEYGLEDPVGRTRQGCADPSPAPRQRLEAPRAANRSANCNLLQESGLCRPPSQRVMELKNLRGPGLKQVRQRGVRGASGTSTASGVA